MSEYLKLVPTGSEVSPVLLEARRLIERRRLDLEVMGISLEEDQSSLEQLVSAKLSNAHLSLEQAQQIHPRAQEIFAILFSGTDPHPPSPAAPGVAVPEDWINTPPANDNDAMSLDQAA